MTVFKDALTVQWRSLCLKDDKLQEILDWNHTEEEVEWPKFIAISAGYVGKSLTETMILLCKLLASDLEREGARIPTNLFCDLYTFLATLDAGSSSLQDKELIENDGAEVINKRCVVPGIGPKVPSDQINDVVQYVIQKGRGQENMIMPENLLNILCPPLDAHWP